MSESCLTWVRLFLPDSPSFICSSKPPLANRAEPAANDLRIENAARKDALVHSQTLELTETPAYRLLQVDRCLAPEAVNLFVRLLHFVCLRQNIDSVPLLTIRFLVRPTTFWRKTRRSGVTGAPYSPPSHLIRRSTYIAAGLQCTGDRRSRRLPHRPGHLAHSRLLHT